MNIRYPISITAALFLIAGVASGAPEKRILFGDLHSHTVSSTDATALDTFRSVTQAFDFARGGPSPNYQGKLVTIETPLDFVGATDHSETMAIQGLCFLEEFGAMGEELCEILRTYNPVSAEARYHAGLIYSAIVIKINVAPVDAPAEIALCQKYDCAAAAVAFWTGYRAEINAYNEAHEDFTTFIGTEYTKHPGGTNHHRQLIYRDHNTAGFPYGYTEARSAGALIALVEAACKREEDCDFLLIDHNPVQSKGTRFRVVDETGAPWTKESAEKYAARIPLVEIFQNKGHQECRIGFGTDDPFCDIENVPPSPQSPLCDAPGKGAYECLAENNYVRNGLKIGLLLHERVGANPFKKGFVGSTDNHDAKPGYASEKNYTGQWGYEDSRPELRLTPTEFLTAEEVNGSSMIYSGFAQNPGGLAAVLAPANNRAEIFAALQRRETYATSGSHIKLRVSGGWQGGKLTVPMGADLPERAGGGAPRFSVTATQDPKAAKLQRIQMIKVWALDGETGEAVYDIAISENQPASGPVVTSGKIADFDEAMRWGSARLEADWQDPDFDPRAFAAYYVRVIEEPSLRYAYYDAVELGWSEAKMARLGAERTIPWTIQERAWASPIWYTP